MSRDVFSQFLGCAGVVAVLLVLTVLFFPSGFGHDKEGARSFACLSNVKQQSLGLLVYAADHDVFPQRDVWMDRTASYRKAEGVLHDPELNKDRKPDEKGAEPLYGYAFNAALSEKRTPAESPSEILVYDSVNPVRNASDLVTSLPHPGRHKGRNSIAYADGHAKHVKVQKQ